MLKSVADLSAPPGRPSAEETAPVEISGRGFYPHVNLARLFAAGVSAGLTLFFAAACWRSLITHAPTWVDGPVLDIMASFHAGRVYQLANLKTMPYSVLTHTPLSYVLAFGLYRIWPGFAALRLVNIIVTSACSILIFRWVHRRTNNAAASTFSACAFLLMPSVFQWSQVTRSPDAFCCFFSLAALSLLESRSKRRDLFIGSLFALAFLSKQTAALVLLPALVASEYMERRSFRSCVTWLATSVAIVAPIFIWLQWATHGGFWLNVFVANAQCAFSLSLFLYIVGQLRFFWIFAALVLALSSKAKTAAHVWAIVALGVGLLTCGKFGADTMYFFDASAAVALLSGIAISRRSTGTAVALLLALLPCVLVSDVVLARTSRPAVQENYRRMLGDLRPFPTILTDEVSIDIQSGRPWYWGDPLVLGQFERHGQWDASVIESGLATHRFAAVVVWSPLVWSKTQSDILHREYHLWKTYPAYKGSYLVYLPNSPGGSR